MVLVIHNKTLMKGPQNKMTAGVKKSAAAIDHSHSSLNMSQLLFQKIGANFNSTADQALDKLWSFGDYYIEEIRVANASVSLTTAAGGVYDTAAKGGNAIVAAGQAYATLDAATKGLQLTLTAFALDRKTAAGLFLALTTAQGVAATADISVFGVPLTEL